MRPVQQYVGAPETKPTPAGPVSPEVIAKALEDANKALSAPSAGEFAREVTLEMSRQAEEIDEVATPWIDLVVDLLPVLGFGGAGLAALRFRKKYRQTMDLVEDRTRQMAETVAGVDDVLESLPKGHAEAVKTKLAMAQSADTKDQVALLKAKAA